MMLNLPAGSYYWSTFLTEEHTPEEMQAWAAAYSQYVEELRAEQPDPFKIRYGWAQKKADDDWQKFL